VLDDLICADRASEERAAAEGTLAAWWKQIDEWRAATA
jgi:hypothetical protein